MQSPSKYRLFCKPEDAHDLQHPQYPEGIHIAAVRRRFEEDVYMTLGYQVIDLIRLSQTDGATPEVIVRQIPVVQAILSSSCLFRLKLLMEEQ